MLHRYNRQLRIVAMTDQDLSAAAIVLNTVFTQPKNVLFAIVLMLLGVPAYFVWRGRGRTRVPVSGVSDSSSA